MPGIKAAKDSQAKRIQEQMRGDDQQQNRQAETSERKPTSDKRADASPDAKDQSPGDRNLQGRLPFIPGANSPKQDRGKDSREGGGRGR